MSLISSLPLPYVAFLLLPTSRIQSLNDHESESHCTSKRMSHEEIYVEKEQWTIEGDLPSKPTLLQNNYVLANTLSTSWGNCTTKGRNGPNDDLVNLC